MSLVNRIVELIKSDEGLIHVGLGNLVSSAAGGLFWFVLASLIVVENYGEINYLISIASVSSIATLFGLNTTVMTFIAKGSAEIRDQANTVILISSIVTVPILFLVANAYCALLLAGMSFFSMSVAELLGKKSYRQYFVLVSAERAAQIVIAVLLYFQIGVNGIVLGYALGALSFSYRYYKSVKNISFRITELRQRFRFIMHNYIFNISQTLTLHADKLIIAPLFGFTVLGLYQLGFQFLIFLAIVPSSMFQYLLPQYSSGRNMKRIMMIGLLLAGVLATIVIAFIPVVITSVFPSYTEAIAAAQIMSIGVIPMTANSILNSKLLGKEKSKIVALGGLTYAGSLLILFSLIGTFLGLAGMGIALLISLCLQTSVLSILPRFNQANKI
ncbi:MAG: lipopolysaccharide biosynthesis protein [Nitrososphaera sp.]